MSEAVIAHWEVTRAKHAGTKPNPHGGQFDKFYVGLKNLDGGVDCEDAYWQRKAPSEVTVGDQVYGKIEEGDYGFRFYLEKDEDGRRTRSSESSTGNNKPASSGGETDWEARNAEIRRQHSQGEAIEALKLAGYPSDGDWDLLKQGIKEWADWFDQDAIAAGQKAGATQGDSDGLSGAAQSSASAVPGQSSASLQPSAVERDLDFSGARTSEPNTVDRDHIMYLLSSAGLVHAGAQEKVADYIMGPLTVEGRAQKALAGLQDHDRQAAVLAQLKSSTEEWTKQPLPQGDALDGEEDPPF